MGNWKRKITSDNHTICDCPENQRETNGALPNSIWVCSCGKEWLLLEFDRVAGVDSIPRWRQV